MIDNYNDLPIGKYMEILSIQSDESCSVIDREVATLSILSDMDELDILHLPIGDFKELARKAEFLKVEDRSRKKIEKIYNVGGMKLIPLTDYRNMITAQYYDFQTYAPEVEKRMPEFLSVFMVPKDHRYVEDYDILDVQKAIRDNLSVSDCLTLCAFFLTLCKESIADIQNYCMEAAKNLPKEQRKKVREKVMSLRTLLH